MSLADRFSGRCRPAGVNATWPAFIFPFFAFTVGVSKLHSAIALKDGDRVGLLPRFSNTL